MYKQCGTSKRNSSLCLFYQISWRKFAAPGGSQIWQHWISTNNVTWYIIINWNIVSINMWSYPSLGLMAIASGWERFRISVAWYRPSNVATDMVPCTTSLQYTVLGHKHKKTWEMVPGTTSLQYTMLGHKHKKTWNMVPCTMSFQYTVLGHKHRKTWEMVPCTILLQYTVLGHKHKKN